MSDACASAPAMTTRCFSPPLSVANGRASSAAVPVAASASRAIARSAGAFELERPEVRIAAHQHHVDDAEIERRLRFLRNDRHAPRQLARAVSPAIGRPSSSTWPHLRLQHARQQLQQRRLARSVRAEQRRQRRRARRRPTRRRRRGRRRRRVGERDVSRLRALLVETQPRKHGIMKSEIQTDSRSDRAQERLIAERFQVVVRWSGCRCARVTETCGVQLTLARTSHAW